jgi:uridine kinase
VADRLSAPVVHMDRLYPGWDGLAASVPILATEVLAPLAGGASAAYRVWDWHHDRWNGREHLAPAPVVVVEGCGSSATPAGAYAAVRVWMEAPRAERMRRGLERDGETYRPHWERWEAQEERLYAVDRTRQKADLVIRTGSARRG